MGVYTLSPEQLSCRIERCFFFFKKACAVEKKSRFGCQFSLALFSLSSHTFDSKHIPICLFYSTEKNINAYCQVGIYSFTFFCLLLAYMKFHPMTSSNTEGTLCRSVQAECKEDIPTLPKVQFLLWCETFSPKDKCINGKGPTAISGPHLRTLISKSAKMLTWCQFTWLKFF